MERLLYLMFMILFASFTLASNANGGCSIGGCGGGVNSWDVSARDFLDSDVPITNIMQRENPTTTSFRAGTAVENNNLVEEELARPTMSMDTLTPLYRSNQYPNSRMLKALMSVSSSDLIIDVSKAREKGQSHIRGSLLLSSNNFLDENGNLKPAEELSRILGNAGISRKDPVVVYGDHFSSGDATFVLWIMKYLGQDDVEALDGGLKDWTDASLPLETKENIRAKTNYMPNLKHAMVADYNYSRSTFVQVADARSYQNSGHERIPNAIYIDPEQVQSEGKLRDAKDLELIFNKLDKNKPTVVCADDLFKASLVWYALQIMGFDSRIYPWHKGAGSLDSGIYKIGQNPV
jgi:3-mercaptopyruvate sulfurtransferase SseA